MLVTLFFIDSQGFSVPLLGRGEIALLLGDHPKLVIGACGAVLVTLSFKDSQGFSVPLLGRGEIAVILRKSGKGAAKCCSVLIHVQVLGKGQGIVEVRPVQRKGTALFV